MLSQDLPPGLDLAEHPRRVVQRGVLRCGQVVIEPGDDIGVIVVPQDAVALTAGTLRDRVPVLARPGCAFGRRPLVLVEPRLKKAGDRAHGPASFRTRSCAARTRSCAAR